MTIAHVANKIFFEGRKGHKESIEAIALLKKNGIHVNIKFAGAIVDNNSQKLMNYAEHLGVSSHVSFVGYIDRNQLDQFLTTADLFILPTKAEGLPRVLIEAMAKGLPCISTRVSGNSELIGDEFLVSYNDVAGLAEKISVFVSNKEVYEKESERNFIKSLSYESSLLQQRRDEFYSQLKKSAELYVKAK